LQQRIPGYLASAAIDKLSKPFISIIWGAEKMKFRTKILGALAALFVVASPAQAQVQTTQSGNGAMLVAVWDGSKSVVVDLNRVSNTAGSDAATLNGVRANGSYTFDLSSILTTAGINLASAQYMVFAGDTLGESGYVASAVANFVNNALSGDSSLLSSGLGGAYLAAAQQIASYTNIMNDLVANGGCGGAISCTFASSNANYWGTQSGNDFNGAQFWSSAATVGNSLQMWSFVQTSGDNGTGTQLAATSLLSSTGQLSISAVPLPAAGWLLLSGLGGLGAASRRRRTAAKA